MVLAETGCGNTSSAELGIGGHWPKCECDWGGHVEPPNRSTLRPAPRFGYLGFLAHGPVLVGRELRARTPALDWVWLQLAGNDSRLRATRHVNSKPQTATLSLCSGHLVHSFILNAFSLIFSIEHLHSYSFKLIYQ